MDEVMEVMTTAKERFMHNALWSLRCICGAFLMAAFSLWLSPYPSCNIGAGSDLVCARGFETRESAYGSTFRWSNGDAEVHLAGTGYGSPVVVHIMMRSGRPAGSEPVKSHIGMNGRLLLRLDVPFYDRHYHFLVHPSLWSSDLSRIQIASATWKPSVLSRTFGLVIIHVRTQLLGDLRLPGPLLVLSWLALLLVAFAHHHPRQFSHFLPLLFLPLFTWLPMLPYLPAISVIIGVLSLFTKHRTALLRLPHLCTSSSESVNHSLAPLFLILPAIPYLILVVTNPSPFGKLALLSGSGVLMGIAIVKLHLLPNGSFVTRSDHWSSLIVLMLLVRLVFLLSRLLSGNVQLDADVELFYAYGMALRQHGIPEVEYPSGALLAWAVLSWLSGNSRERFALLLPLLNIGCEIVIFASLATLCASKKPLADGRTSIIPALWYGFSPLLEPFVFGKYDSLPTALAIGALALFATNRLGWAGFALGIGTTIKWTPLLSVPFLLLYLFRHHQWKGLWRFALLFVVGILVCSLPFALVDWNKFLKPYVVQGGRGMNGESMWGLVALLIEPDIAQRMGAPWGTVWSSKLSVPLMVGVQMGILVLLGCLALIRALDLWRTIALAAIAPSLFLLTNRVFSPQYLIPISGGILAALAGIQAAAQSPNPSPEGQISSRAVEPLHTTALQYMPWALLVLAQVSNLFVWPWFLQDYWVNASAVLFGVLLVLHIKIIAKTYKK